LVYKHSRNYTRPHLQRCIVRILFMVPIYSIDSFFSLLFKDYSLYFDLIRDCYEAYILFMFFTLLVNYIEDESGLPIYVLLSKKSLMSHPFPTCFLPKFQPGPTFLNVCRLCILQFTIFKPFFTLISLTLESVGLFEDGNFDANRGYLWITLLDNFSITISMYFLILFYMAVKEELAGFNPVPKFLCIKSIIFFSFWQGVAIAVMVKIGWIHSVGSWTTDNVSNGLQDFIICIEMFIVSVVHRFVFAYEPFRNPNKEGFVRSILKGNLKESTKPLFASFSDFVNPRYDIETTKSAMQPLIVLTKKGPVINNINNK